MHARNQTRVLQKSGRAASALEHGGISPAPRFHIFLETRPENVIQHFCFHFIVQNKITWYMALSAEGTVERTLIAKEKRKCRCLIKMPTENPNDHSPKFGESLAYI